MWRPGRHTSPLRPPPTGAGAGAGPAHRSAEQVLADYREAIEASNAAIRAVGDPAVPMARPVDDKLLSLRWLLAHATSETARHAGHATSCGNSSTG
jgi:Protein of unknown function (DUF664)